MAPGRQRNRVGQSGFGGRGSGFGNRWSGVGRVEPLRDPRKQPRRSCWVSFIDPTYVVGSRSRLSLALGRDDNIFQSVVTPAGGGKAAVEPGPGELDRTDKRSKGCKHMGLTPTDPECLSPQKKRVRLRRTLQSRARGRRRAPGRKDVKDSRGKSVLERNYRETERASRKPTTLLRKPEVPLRRSAARRNCGSTLHDPPRTTRRLQSPVVLALPSVGASR
jgi:hypothetical protein